jgi:hypothetical protein
MRMMQFSQTLELAERTTCPVTGNSDLYGLGIRIGIYLQMFTAQFSGYISQFQDEDDDIGQGVVVFTLSASIVLIRLILKRQIEPVEIFPILSLLLAQLATCRVPYWRAQMTIFVYNVCLIGILVLFFWFWWHGMDTLPRSCPDDYAFFFHKVSIWHWFRKLNKAFSVAAMIITPIGILIYLVSMWFHRRQTRQNRHFEK